MAINTGIKNTIESLWTLFNSQKKVARNILCHRCTNRKKAVDLCNLSYRLLPNYHWTCQSLHRSNPAIVSQRRKSIIIIDQRSVWFYSVPFFNSKWISLLHTTIHPIIFNIAWKRIAWVKENTIVFYFSCVLCNISIHTSQLHRYTLKYNIQPWIVTYYTIKENNKISYAP